MKLQLIIKKAFWIFIICTAVGGNAAVRDLAFDLEFKNSRVINVDTDAVINSNYLGGAVTIDPMSWFDLDDALWAQVKSRFAYMKLGRVRVMVDNWWYCTGIYSNGWGMSFGIMQEILMMVDGISRGIKDGSKRFWMSLICVRPMGRMLCLVFGHRPI